MFESLSDVDSLHISDIDSEDTKAPKKQWLGFGSKKSRKGSTEEDRPVEDVPSTEPAAASTNPFDNVHAEPTGDDPFATMHAESTDSFADMHDESESNVVKVEVAAEQKKTKTVFVGLRKGSQENAFVGLRKGSQENAKAPAKAVDKPVDEMGGTDASTPEKEEDPSAAAKEKRGFFGLRKGSRAAKPNVEATKPAEAVEGEAEAVNKEEAATNPVSTPIETGKTRGLLGSLFSAKGASKEKEKAEASVEPAGEKDEEKAKEDHSHHEFELDPSQVDNSMTTMEVDVAAEQSQAEEPVAESEDFMSALSNTAQGEDKDKVKDKATDPAEIASPRSKQWLGGLMSKLKKDPTDPGGTPPDNEEPEPAAATEGQAEAAAVVDEQHEQDVEVAEPKEKKSWLGFRRGSYKGKTTKAVAGEEGEKKDAATEAGVEVGTQEEKGKEAEKAKKEKRKSDSDSKDPERSKSWLGGFAARSKSRKPSDLLPLGEDGHESFAHEDVSVVGPVSDADSKHGAGVEEQDASADLELSPRAGGRSPELSAAEEADKQPAADADKQPAADADDDFDFLVDSGAKEELAPPPVPASLPQITPPIVPAEFQSEREPAGPRRPSIVAPPAAAAAEPAADDPFNFLTSDLSPTSSGGLARPPSGIFAPDAPGRPSSGDLFAPDGPARPPSADMFENAGAATAGKDKEDEEDGHGPGIALVKPPSLPKVPIVSATPGLCVHEQVPAVCMLCQLASKKEKGKEKDAAAGASELLPRAPSMMPEHEEEDAHVLATSGQEHGDIGASDFTARNDSGMDLASAQSVKGKTARAVDSLSPRLMGDTWFTALSSSNKDDDEAHDEVAPLTKGESKTPVKLGSKMLSSIGSSVKGLIRSRDNPSPAPAAAPPANETEAERKLRMRREELAKQKKPEATPKLAGKGWDPLFPYHAKPFEAVAWFVETNLADGLSEKKAKIRAKKEQARGNNDFEADPKPALTLGKDLNDRPYKIYYNRKDRLLVRAKNLFPRTAWVVRGGKTQEIPVKELVVGDVVLLDDMERNVVPADLRIFECSELQVSMDGLLGTPSKIDLDNKEQDHAHPIFCSNLAFVGSRVLRGLGKGIVVATGIDTMIGRGTNSSLVHNSMASTPHANQKTVESLVGRHKLTPLDQQAAYMLSKVNVLIMDAREVNTDGVGSFDTFKDALKVARESNIKLLICSEHNDVAIKRTLATADLKVTDFTWGTLSQFDEAVKLILESNTDKPFIFTETESKQRIRLAAALQQAEQVLAALGDQLSDLELIRTVDVGVAWWDAHAFLRTNADFISSVDFSTELIRAIGFMRKQSKFFT